MSQVIVNLLSNSLKYTSFNGRILLDVTGDEEHAYLVINDSGVGIPNKDLANVFNRFYRSDASRARATGGAGIGLTIAKSIVEAHRGSIDIVSQENLGTEITVILPKR
ncbi:MAG: sensor histidine kinase [Thermincola sp.]|nr:sensor histidine kinase [Thermincola sp.]